MFGCKCIKKSLLFNRKCFKTLFCNLRHYSWIINIMLNMILKIAITLYFIWKSQIFIGGNITFANKCEKRKK